MITNLPKINKNSMLKFCDRWQIKDVAVFGSVLRHDFDNKSDIDILVTFTDGSNVTLLNHIEMQKELDSIFNRNIDLLTRRSVEKSHNKIRKEEILNSAKIIFSNS